MAGKMVGVAPSAPEDFATKGYVDTAVLGRAVVTSYLLLGGGTTNNYSIASDPDVSHIRFIIASTGTAGLTGIVPVSARLDKVLTLLNDSTSTATLELRHENAGSTAANRFNLGGYATPGYITLSPGDAASLTYVASISRWVLTSVQRGGTALATPETNVTRDSSGRTQFAFPAADSDAATRGSSRRDASWKWSVRAATTANITLSGTQTVDGVALTVGDRALVKDQTTGSQNGIYRVASGAWTREQDFTPGTYDVFGAYVGVATGTLNAGTVWRCDIGAVSATSFPFSQVAGELTVAPTASAPMLRDSAGRSQVADPSAAQDIATKNYVDNVAQAFASPQTWTLNDSVTYDDKTIGGADPDRVAYVRARVYGSSTPATITGIVIDPALRLGRSLVIQNSILSTANIVLQREGAGSTAAYRITTPTSDVVIPPGDSIELSYDASSSRWIVVGTALGTHSAEAFALVKRDSASRAQVADPSAAQDIATKNYVDVSDPAGTVKIWAGSSAPAGHLLCDGSAVSRTTYAALYAVIGTTYGVGDGSTTFNLPDLLGRVVVGQDAGQSEFNVLGETGGSKTHSHPLSSNGWALARIATAATTLLGRFKTVASWTATATASIGTVSSSSTSSTVAIELSGDTDSASTLQPYMALNYIIKA